MTGYFAADAVLLIAVICFVAVIAIAVLQFLDKR